MTELLSFITNNSIVIIPFGVIILLLIFVLIGVALTKTAAYFVERFPREEKDQVEYYSYKAKAAQLKSEVDAYNEAIDRLRQEYENAIKESKDHLDEAVIKDNLQSELEKIERDLEMAQNELTATNIENCKNKSEAQMLNDVLPNLREKKESAENKLKELELKIEGLSEKKKELDELQSMSSSLSMQNAIAKNSYEDLKAKLDKLKVEEENSKDLQSKIKKIELDIAEKQSKLDRLNQDVASSSVLLQELTACNDKIKAETESLKKEHNKTKEDFIEGYKNLVNPPASLKEFSKKEADTFDTEIREINKFQSYLESKGYFFSDRTIKAFHTALKIQNANPLTVLAGISGTGKTLLPTKYAEYFGIYSLVLPVEPRWDSPQDLLGFYNYLEKKYQATELSKTLVAFDSKNDHNICPRSAENEAISKNLENRMLIVLLDEMNLARTEYYFSNFLSRLELRRIVTNENEKANRKNAEITIDDNFGNIWVPNNVLFVGTMNEDESTQTLSDKVLDRANLIRFGKPSEKNIAKASNSFGRTDTKAHIAMAYSTFKNWIVKDEDTSKSLGEDENFVNDNIKLLNEAMSYIGKPFGFRVNDAIRSYIANYPKDPGNENQEVRLAFADQIEQKIMPKLRGLDLSLLTSQECLHRVAEIIDKLGDDQLSETFINVKNDNGGTGMFMWQGVSR